MQRPEYLELWTKIQQFAIDDETSTVRFSDKLASEQGWQPAFTARAIEEYKKFILLCCISPTGAAPSKIVDEVWHLHLTYTQSYWTDFCKNVLGKEIHHFPSGGGKAEDDRHRQWYAGKLMLYKDIFGTAPARYLAGSTHPGSTVGIAPASAAHRDHYCHRIDPALPLPV